jgi:fermentation-respiration switch protein FrsA (DUF1100 family)
MPGFFILASLCVFMFGCERMLLYFPDSRDRALPKDHTAVYEDVFFRSSDGLRLHGWFLPAQGGKAKGTVLHVHGNAANITGHYGFICWLPAAGYNVLTFDYRGYGRSEGSVTRDGTILDALAALEYLRTCGKVDPDSIVVFGQSIGGAVSIAMAAQRKDQIKALAIDSTFTTYRDVVRFHSFRQPSLVALIWWVPLTIPAGHDPIKLVADLSPLPLFFIHGKRDNVVPWWMSQQLCDAAKEPKSLWLIDDTNHTQVWDKHEKQAQDRLTAFFDGALQKEPAQPQLSGRGAAP